MEPCHTGSSIYLGKAVMDHAVDLPLFLLVVLS
jgi:hypothetical protein